MSQPPQRHQPVPVSEPASGSDAQLGPEPERDAAAPPLPEEPTVGTGSVVAVGCVIAMLLVLVLGIMIVLWTR